MDILNLASGDNKKSQLSSRSAEDVDDMKPSDCNEERSNLNENVCDEKDITPQIIDDNETKLKGRIALCRNIIESLKSELNEEKAKLEKESKSHKKTLEFVPKTSEYHHASSSDILKEDLAFSSTVYSACVDSKLNCDENLIEYEKQLQKYQNTLNIAQIEKKNAIRKQMLAKAYKLKLLEVENQCNIELLRVKQSLQCLEPLQMIANKWKTNTDDIYDINSFDLIPRYPELSANSGSDLNSYREELDLKSITEQNEKNIKEDCASSSC